MSDSRNANAGHRRRSQAPLFSSLSHTDQAAHLHAVTLQIAASRKLSLYDVATVAAALGPVLGRISRDIAAGRYEAITPNPRYPDVVRFQGPDGVVFPHWGIAYPRGFASSVGITPSLYGHPDTARRSSHDRHRHRGKAGPGD